MGKLVWSWIRRTETAAGNYTSAYCNLLNTGLSTMGGSRNQEETSTGDDPKKDSGWEVVVVANEEIGRIEIIQPRPSG